MLRKPYLFLAFFLFGTYGTAQRIDLTVPTGAPLRVYLTKRLPKRLDEPVQARLIEPLFAFDREVAPAGSSLVGKIVRLDPVSKMMRASAILGGDFTPLHQAEVQFTTLVLPGGREVPLQTIETVGLNSIFVVSPPKKAKKQSTPNTGVLGTAKQTARDQINAQLSARTQGVIDLVRGPDKKERLIDFLVMKLPYHPQWVRKGTRFDPELSSPLQFGETAIEPAALRLLASQPPADTVVHARLITPLNSLTATQGEKVEALLTQPLFAPNHQLILPEGARLSGAVTMVHRARWFHRGGQLRFNFQNIDLPPGVTLPQFVAKRPVIKAPAQLDGAESGSKATLKVDSEGTAKATESKTRFLAPALALLVASRAADNDAGKHTASGTGEPNVSGRTLGGGLGFGLVGSLLAQKSPTFGKAMGYYGLAWSVYLNIVARGQEVEFGKNAVVDIRFGAHKPPAAASKLIAKNAP
jgi:hypothetical protein